MRRSLAVLAVIGSTIALSACSGASTDPTDSATSASVPCATSGAVSDGVDVTGDVGSKPTTTIASPVSVEETQKSVVSEGDGATVEDGDMVTLDYTLYNGTSGAEIDASGYSEDSRAAFIVDSGQYLPGLVAAVNCTTVGSRVVAVVTPEDAFGTTGNEALGVAADDSLVFVIDVEEIIPTVATGAEQPAQEGFPAVELAEDGTPTVTIPDADAPTTLQTEVLKKGDGATVQDGDTLVVQYQGVIWRTGEIFDQSWGSGAPSTFSTSSVIDGFKQAVVGQTVGSQVVVIIPPEQGYGAEGNSTAGIEGTDTLVFVIDVLAIG